jgi:PadR family transcriptional regulator AphA
MSRGPERTTPYALLGLLALGPGSGYDLKRRAESTVGYFWAENYGQIYPALKQLTAARLVSRKVQAPRVAGRPPRQVYAITNKGMAALTTWLAAPPRVEPFRSEMLLKLFFGFVSGPRIQESHLRRVREQEARRLTDYRAIESELPPDVPPYCLMTLSYGRHRSEAVIAWIDETLLHLGSLHRTSRRP